MEEQQEKTQGKKTRIKKLVGRIFTGQPFTLKRVHIWRWLCDRQPDEEKVRR